MHIEISLGQLAHDAGDVLHIAVDQGHRGFQRICQLAQLVFRLVPQLQVQVALLHHLTLVGDVQNRTDHPVHYIPALAEQADEVDDKADDCRDLKHHNRLLQARVFRHADGLLPFNHFVQGGHQRSQGWLNLALEALLRRGGIEGVLLQQLARRLMERVVQRFNNLHLCDDLRVVTLLVSVEPLAQGAAGIVQASGKLRTGIERIAQVAGPAVVGRFCAVGPAEQIVGVLRRGVRPFDQTDIGQNHDTEKQRSQYTGANANQYRAFDTCKHIIHSPTNSNWINPVLFYGPNM